jgi:glycosyltransferase involved in cell wall biosynthesis
MARIHVLENAINRCGGAGVYVGELCRQLSRRGHDVELICFTADPTLGAEVTVHRIKRSSMARRAVIWRAAAMCEMLSSRREIRSLQLRPADMVIGCAQQLLWAYHRCHPQVPWFYLPHSLVAPIEVDSYPCPSTLQKRVTAALYERLERWALRGARRTIRFTHAGCDALATYYGIADRSRFVVLPTPVPLPADFPEPPREPLRLLSIGRLVNTKNIELLIRSLASLTHLPWVLDIIGDGEEREALLAAVGRAQLGERVFLRGHQDDVNRWYRSAHLFLFPSRLESAGLVVLEAMSHCVPVLAMRADGQNYRNVNHELITSGRDGFLASTEQEFAGMLAELLAAPERLRQVGRVARQTVQRHHQWDVHMDRFEKAIAQTIKPRALTRSQIPLCGAAFGSCGSGA